MSDECIFCGAGLSKIIKWADGIEYIWDCGSWKTPSRTYRSEDCYVLQIYQLQEHIEGMESELADYARTVKKLREQIANLQKEMRSESHLNGLRSA